MNLKDIIILKKKKQREIVFVIFVIIYFVVVYVFLLKIQKIFIEKNGKVIYSKKVQMHLIYPLIN